MGSQEAEEKDEGNPGWKNNLCTRKHRQIQSLSSAVRSSILVRRQNKITAMAYIEDFTQELVISCPIVKM